ncbi:hypothetical protein ACJMK2_002341 [Sinanodonta woodiana]|uniref:N-acetylgalactosaminide beta-1,3-galactosyltransferase n=1 Tax=Sinanodonta woodiana TaxID=1069815 RepID=A0ABD3XWT6_SINWO
MGIRIRFKLSSKKGIVLILFTFVGILGIFYRILLITDQIELIKEFSTYDMRKAEAEERTLLFNGTSAKILSRQIRLYCISLTMEKDITTKAKAVKDTWAKRCTKHFFIVTSNIKLPGFISLDIEDKRTTLIPKMISALQFVYRNYIDKFDWLLKTDDDTYVIVENLRLLLSNYNGSKPAYMGYHFNKFVPSGYMSGGAGYVISNSALRQFVEKGLNKQKCKIGFESNIELAEDIEIGNCLSELKVPILNSTDMFGKETFHPYHPKQHVLGPLPSYLHEWSQNRPREGPMCCSQYSISFHYVQPSDMYVIDHLLYRTSVYGIQQSLLASKTVFPKHSNQG